MTEEAPSSSDEVFNQSDSGNDNQVTFILEKHKCLTEEFKAIQALGVPITKEGKVSLSEMLETESLVTLSFMKRLLIENARKVQTVRQMSVLETDEEMPIGDPSIQFFGIEWSLLFKRWQRIGRKIVSYNKSLESRKVDMMLLASIIKMMNQTQLELEHHRVAIVSGHLTQEHLETQLSNQRRVSNIGEQANKEKEKDIR